MQGKLPEAVDLPSAPSEFDDDLRPSENSRRGLGIRQKIFFLVLSSALVPAFVVGTVSYFSARSILTEKVHTQLEARLAAATGVVESAMAERVADIEVFANAFVVSQTLEQAATGTPVDAATLANLERYLDEVVDRYLLYRELVVVDKTGRAVVRSTAGDADGRIRLPAGRPRAAATTYLDASGGERLLVVSQVVRSSEGRLVGALVVAAALDDLWRDLRSRVGDSSERLMLMDSRGSALFDSRSLGEAPDVETRSPLIEAGQENAPGIFEYSDMRGRDVLAALGAIPSYELALLLEMDAMEAYGAVSRLGTVMSLISLFAALLVIGLGALFAVNLTRPIDALIDGARLAAEGDLSGQIAVTSADEVGELTMTFNLMIRSLRRSQERLEVLSVTDELTGLYNRRYLTRALDSELKRAMRYGGSFGVIMIDLDRFKAFNDDRGHPEGDSFLREAAAMLESEFRPSDIVARYGGEEFVVLLPEAEKAQAGAIAERVRLRFAERAQGQEETPRVTISAGVAAYPEDGITRTELLVKADTALYRAKRMGRNRVELCEAA